MIRTLSTSTELGQLVNANLAGLPSHPSHAPRRHLDFILHSPQLSVSNFLIPDIRLSDHAPLIAELRFRQDH